jgi:hypothetical protein
MTLSNVDRSKHKQCQHADRAVLCAAERGADFVSDSGLLLRFLSSDLRLFIVLVNSTMKVVRVSRKAKTVSKPDRTQGEHDAKRADGTSVEIRGCA